MDENMTTESYLEKLHSEGKSKTQSIVALAREFSMPLDQAKKTVHLSRTWDESRERDEQFHSELLGGAPRVITEKASFEEFLCLSLDEFGNILDAIESKDIALAVSDFTPKNRKAVLEKVRLKLDEQYALFLEQSIASLQNAPKSQVLAARNRVLEAFPDVTSIEKISLELDTGEDI